jgi:type I restriction-modification system DNA methylase subunit
VKELTRWHGKVDYILANPPFSLRIDYEQFDSPLFSFGYRNSDALFIDTAFKLLRPGGRLVCLLPHSIIANREFAALRTLVENSWNLCGVICLPEGVFHLSAGTTTRADIVILEKKATHGGVAAKRVFASVPTVGLQLNNQIKTPVGNDLEGLLVDHDICDALGIEREDTAWTKTADSLFP